MFRYYFLIKLSRQHLIGSKNRWEVFCIIRLSNGKTENQSLQPVFLVLLTWIVQLTTPMNAFQMFASFISSWAFPENSQFCHFVSKKYVLVANKWLACVE